VPDSGAPETPDVVITLSVVAREADAQCHEKGNNWPCDTAAKD